MKQSADFIVEYCSSHLGNLHIFKESPTNLESNSSNVKIEQDAISASKHFPSYMFI